MSKKDERISLRLWREDGERCGWKLPPPASWPLRLPVIRNLRCAWNSWQVERHYAIWGTFGMVRSGYDEWVLFAIARGMC
jgi:hypothetical protein